MLKKILVFWVSTLFAVVVYAANTVEFNGQVAAQTCDVTVNGSASPVVLLPTVSVADVEGNDWVGETPFSVVLANCIAPDKDYMVRIELIAMGPPSIGDFMIGNAGSARGVSLIILDSVGATQSLDLGVFQTFDLGILAAGSNSLTHTFAAAYAKDLTSPVMVGSFRGSLQYKIIYP